MNHSGFLFQVHSHFVQCDARAERIWQSPFVIINPQTANGTGVWMTSCPDGPVNLRILKRRQWGIRPLKTAVEFSDVESCDRALQISTDGELKLHDICRTLGGGSTLYGYQRLLRIVSLSSCPKPEINKPVLIWNERARLCLYMYSITIITDIIKKYATKRRLKRY